MDKQDNLEGSEFITISDNNEIVLEVEALRDELEGIDGTDGREVEIGSNETHLLWRYVGDTAWNELIALDALRGQPGERGEKGEKGDKGEPGDAADVDLTPYSTTAEMNAAIAAAIAAIDTSAMTAHMSDNTIHVSTAEKEYWNAKLDSDLGTGKENKVLVTDDEGKVTVVDRSDLTPDMSGYYTSSETDTAIDTAIAGIDLSGKVDVAQGTGKENKVLVTDASGNVTTAPKSDFEATNKVDIYQGTDKDNVFMTTDDNGVVVASDIATSTLTDHVTDTGIHVTTSDKTRWDAKQNRLIGVKGQIVTIADPEDGNSNSSRTVVSYDGYDTAAVDSAFESVAAYNSIPTTKATDVRLDNKLRAKVDVDQTVANANKVLATDTEGKVYASGDYYTKSEVDQAINNIDISGLGDLAYKDEIVNADVADNAQIERSKLASDIQEALSSIMEDVPDDGNQYVLSVVDGTKTWVPVQQ